MLVIYVYIMKFIAKPAEFYYVKNHTRTVFTGNRTERPLAVEFDKYFLFVKIDSLEMFR